MSGIRASVSSSPFSLLHTKPKFTHHSSPNLAVSRSPSTPSNLKLRGIPHFPPNSSPRSKARCCSSSGPGGFGSGDGDSRTVLDAFFLGKALAEALTERIESTVGEVLSGIGRLQAERQKQIVDFQEEVIERAKRAKDKAARDSIEVQEPISPSITSPTIAVTSTDPQQLSKPDPYSESTVNLDPPLDVTNDEE
ncbi:uncharacterized protein At4g13200, chloroplastic [Momordica charantia]|uniref:Uncharacterized protein At4g13200, chloroplastic n=1 Tax=Momordica charantia TaxID=3673 RepID=A0A6J1DJG4_MOMCH|nr:uncharacterized protein At4g13200, chloroplastic [Momordica charantia]